MNRHVPARIHADQVWRLVLLVMAVVVSLSFGPRWMVAAPPNPAIAVTTVASPSPPPTPSPVPTAVATPIRTEQPLPTAGPPESRHAVDVSLVRDPASVFTSQITNKDCAVSGTQMVLTVLGLGNASDAFQVEIHDRIGEWETWDDSHNGGWGPTAIGSALAAYGATGYEEQVYATRAEALRVAAAALSTTHKPVVLLAWWGAHTWVMTGYRADADPTVFPDATVTGTYILDPWYPRISTIWGPSDPPGTFQDAAEMERNFIGWSRPEGRYPTRDGRFVIVVPTTAREAAPTRLDP